MRSGVGEREVKERTRTGKPGKRPRRTRRRVPDLNRSPGIPYLSSGGVDCSPAERRVRSSMDPVIGYITDTRVRCHVVAVTAIAVNAPGLALSFDGENKHGPRSETCIPTPYPLKLTPPEYSNEPHRQPPHGLPRSCNIFATQASSDFPRLASEPYRCLHHFVNLTPFAETPPIYRR